MNAMLEARIVAASTQRPRVAAHPDPEGAARTTFSSQGSLLSAHISAGTMNFPSVRGYSGCNNQVRWRGQRDPRARRTRDRADDPPYLSRLRSIAFVTRYREPFG